MADLYLAGPWPVGFVVIVSTANDEPRRTSTARLTDTAGCPVSPVTRTPAMIEPDREPPEFAVPPSREQ